MVKQKIFIDKNWLENQYLKQGKTERQIAKEMHVSRTAVFRWRIRYKIPSKKQLKSKLTKANH